MKTKSGGRIQYWYGRRYIPSALRLMAPYVRTKPWSWPSSSSAAQEQHQADDEAREPGWRGGAKASPSSGRGGGLSHLGGPCAARRSLHPAARPLVPGLSRNLSVWHLRCNCVRGITPEGVICLHSNGGGFNFLGGRESSSLERQPSQKASPRPAAGPYCCQPGQQICPQRTSRHTKQHPIGRFRDACSTRIDSSWGIHSARHSTSSLGTGR